jgi:hypothetical protein
VRFPSVDAAARAAADTVRRFPAAVLCGVVAAASASVLVERDGEHLALRWFLTATLGLALFPALATRASRFPARKALGWGTMAAGGALLAAFLLATGAWRDPVLARRYAQISLGFHSFVAVFAYWRFREPHGFWQFNRRLFERFLVAAVFSGVLFVGLVLALVALNRLFGVTVRDETYAHLGFAIAFVFHPMYFLGGIPRDLPSLEEQRDYPAGLRIFSQYILVPLVLLYLVILTAYLGRVAITRVWPSGWIGWLVSGVAILGILALLLVHPVREREENRWVGTFARGFWIAMLPALVMLFLSIVKRVQQYGVTENRYFLFVFALWLGGLCVYFIVRRGGSIAAIPWSLVLVTLGTAFGPWGVYAVSERSQVHRLRATLEEQGLLAGDRAIPAEGEIPYEVRREIGAGFRYLAEHHGTARVDAWFPEGSAPLDSLRTRVAERHGARDAAGPLATAYLAELGLEYVEGRPLARDRSVQVTIESDFSPTALWDVRDWDYVVELQGPGWHIPRIPGGAEIPRTEPFSVSVDPGGRALLVYEGDSVWMEIPRDAVLERVHAEVERQGPFVSLSPESLVVEHETPVGQARLQLRGMTLEEKDGEDRAPGIRGILLLRRR